MSVEAHVLTRLSDDIESELLSVMQIKVRVLAHTTDAACCEETRAHRNRAPFSSALAYSQTWRERTYSPPSPLGPERPHSVR